MCGSRKFHRGGGGGGGGGREGSPDNFCYHQCFYRGPYGTPSISKGSVPVFLRKPIAICDFPRVGVGCPEPLSIHASFQDITDLVIN